MANNTTLNSMSGGDVIGDDDVSGVKYQVVKPGYSASGGAPTQVDKTHGLPVNEQAESFDYQSGQTNTKHQVSASPLTLKGLTIENPNATVAYLQLFNAASASVTVGTTVADDVIPIPAGASASIPAILRERFNTSFTTALTIAITTTRTGLTAMGSACPTTVYYATN